MVFPYFFLPVSTYEQPGPMALHSLISGKSPVSPSSPFGRPTTAAYRTMELGPVRINRSSLPTLTPLLSPTLVTQIFCWFTILREIWFFRVLLALRGVILFFPPSSLSISLSSFFPSPPTCCGLALHLSHGVPLQRPADHPFRSPPRSLSQYRAHLPRGP